MAEPLQEADALLQLIRFDRPIGTLLSPVAHTVGPLDCRAAACRMRDLLVIFVAGTFLTRSAGCIVNDLADRHRRRRQ